MVINCTPHAVTIAGYTIPPSGQIARALETSTIVGSLRSAAHPPIPLTRTEYTALVMSIPAPTGDPSDRMDVGFPEPSEAVYYVVSLVAVQCAARVGRTTADLLVPGQQLRDEQGRVIGCRSLDVPQAV